MVWYDELNLNGISSSNRKGYSKRGLGERCKENS